MFEGAHDVKTVWLHAETGCCGSSPLVRVPGAFPIFDASFYRVDYDLTVVGDDGQRLHVADYFAWNQPPRLVRGEADFVGGDLVTRLALLTSLADGSTTTTDTPVARVETVEGVVRVIHDTGQTATVEPGDAIRQGDVLLLSGGKVTLVLPDGSQLDAATIGRLIVEHMGPSADADGVTIVLRAEGGSFTFRPSHTPSPAVGADITILTPVAQIDPAQAAFAFRYSFSEGLRVWLLEDAGGAPIVVENQFGLVELHDLGVSIDVPAPDVPPQRLPTEVEVTQPPDTIVPPSSKLVPAHYVSPGGDKTALPDDLIEVSGQSQSFELTADAGVLPAVPRHLPEEVLLQFAHPPDGSQQATSSQEVLLRDWDHEPGGGTWSVIGSAHVYGPVPEFPATSFPRAISPVEGSHMAVVVPGLEGIGDIERFLGLTAQQLAGAVTGSQPAAVSAIKRTMTLSAGTELSFDWFLDAGNETPRQDVALVTIGDHVFRLADSIETGVGGATGWRTFIYTVPKTMTVTFGFVVVNDLTPDGPSRLMVDNVFIGRTFDDSYVDVDSGDGWRVVVQKPSVGDDTLMTTEDSRAMTTALALLANDVDPDPFDAMRITGIDNEGTLGRVTYSGTGEVIYDPAGRFNRLSAGETAADTFRYEVDAGNGIRGVGTVRVTIEGINDAPTAVDDPDVRVSAAGPAIQIDVLANDDDVDSDDDRTSLKIVSASSASGAQVDVSGVVGGTISYRPDVRFASLAEGEAVIDPITYTIEDRHGARATAIVEVTVTGVNDSPVAADDRIDTDEDAPAAFNPLSNDADPDLSDQLRVSAVEGVAVVAGSRVALVSGASVEFTVDGRLVYDPTGHFEELAEGQAASDTLRYSIEDGHGGRAEATVSVTITGRNDAPVADRDNAVALEDATGLSIGVLANDDDIDSDDDHSSLRVVSASASSGAAVSVSGLPGEGVIYDAAGRFEALGEGETGTDTITYLIEDRHGARATGTVEVTIVGANDAPLAAADQQTVSEDTGAVVAVLANDRDPDAHDQLHVIAIDGTLIAAGGPVVLASGAVVTLSSDGALAYDPSGSFDALSEGDAASDAFRYTIGDGHGGLADAMAVMTILGLNDAPVLQADAAGAFEDGPAITVDALANDDDPDGDDDRTSLRIVAASAQSGAIVSFSGVAGEGLVYDPAGRFDFVGEGETATDIITYTVEDRHGARSSATVMVSVDGTNDAPQANDDLLMVDANSVLSLPPTGLLGNDRDPDASDRLRVIAVNGLEVSVGGTVTLASGGLLTVDEDGGLTYDPNGRFDGLTDFQRATDDFEYTVSDSHGSIASAQVTIDIQGRNDPPEAGADAAVTDQDSAVRIPVLINDQDPDAGGNLRVLSVDTSGSRGTVRINPDGTLTYDPNGAFSDLQAGESTIDTFDYVLDDYVGGRSTGTVTVSVIGVAHPQQSAQELLQSFEASPGSNFAWSVLGAMQSIAVYPLAGGDAFIPTHGGSMALLTADAAGAGALGRFLSENVSVAGQPLVRLDDGAEGHSSANSGTGMRSAISVAPDDAVNGQLTLSFDWNFISAETNPVASGINDFAVLTLSDGVTARVFTLADAKSTVGASEGWRTTVVDITALFSLPQEGDLRLVLGFAVLNDKVQLNASQLLIDNVRLNRSVGAAFEVVGTDPSGDVITYRERPEAIDDLIAGTSAGAVDEDQSVRLEVSTFLGNDRVSAGVSVETLRLVGVETTGTIGQATFEDSGIVYDPRGRFDVLAEGETGIDTFFYTLRDANGGTSAGQATIVVTGINDAPVTVDDTASVGEHSDPVTLDVLQNDDDPDSDDDRSTLRIVAAGAASGAAVSFSGLAGAGVIYDPRGVAAFAGLGDGETVSDLLSYTIEDRHGVRSTGSVSITVTGVNDSPTATSDQATTDEDSAVTIAVLTNDTDPDLRDHLSVGGINTTVVTAGSQVTLASGAVVFVNADGTVRYDPGAAFAALAREQTGSDSFVYMAVDGHGGSSQATVSVSVTGRNDAPVAGTDALSTDAATRLTVATSTLLSNDHDPDVGDHLHIVDIDVTGTQGSVTFDGTSIHYDPTGQFRSLGEGETAQDTFAYRLADDDGVTSIGQAIVTVHGINDAPDAVDDAASTDEETPVTVNVLNNDTDPDINDVHSLISVDTTNTRGAVTLNPDGTVTYDPNGRFDQLNAGQTDYDSFRYVISDGHGGSDEAQVTVTIDGRSSTTERLVNSFETPFSSGERTTSAVTTVGSYEEADGAHGTYTPTDGLSMASLRAYGTSAQKIGSQTVSKLEDFLGIPDQSLFRDPGDSTYPNNGSAFKLSVDVTDGEQISFDWVFDARDVLPDNDYAVFTVVGDGDPQVFKLSDVRETGSNGASGWNTSVYTASSATSLTIGFAVINDRSPSPSSENSYLLVDNVRLNRDLGESYQVSQSHDPSTPFETINLA